MEAIKRARNARQSVSTPAIGSESGIEDEDEEGSGLPGRSSLAALVVMVKRGHRFCKKGWIGKKLRG